MVRQMALDDLDLLVPLFDQYMVFYGKPSQPDRHREYLESRLAAKQAVIFGFFSEHDVLSGFVLNYFSFSSVSLGKIVVLNDLFVVPFSRGQGIGEALIRRSWELAKEHGAVRVDLGTAKTNEVAQGLYEKLGFVRDNEFFSYSYAV